MNDMNDMNEKNYLCDIFDGINLEEIEAGARELYKQQWETMRHAYHNNPGDFYTAWHYLSQHPALNEASGPGRFPCDLYITVVKVNPDTMEIDDNGELNRKLQVWVECSVLAREDDAPEGYLSAEEKASLEPGGVLRMHDYDLDTGGDNFESAIIELAHLVSAKYGDDRSQVYRKRDEADGTVEAEADIT